MAKTKIDRLVDKLVELTNDDYLPWEQEMHEKYDYPVFYFCNVKIGEYYHQLQIPLNSKENDCLLITTSDEATDKFYPKELNTLRRAIQERINSDWQVLEVIDDILKGAIDGSKGMDESS